MIWSRRVRFWRLALSVPFFSNADMLTVSDDVSVE
jgi:hypothetical protein